ncbi:MAG: HAD family hydrolase [Actinomycetota bacterium]|nr:HAD family hydrolase [Actinomycetota bacterium]
MKPDTAVVDVDGTLVDTNYHHALAWVRALARSDLYPPVWRVHRAIGMGGDRLVAEIAGNQAERDHGDAVREAWAEEYDPLLREVRVLAGARELLGYLREHRVTVVLATSGKPEHVSHYLDLLGGREVAAQVVTAEDADASKPAPDLVSAALDRVDASSAVMVGDSVWDVRAAAAVDVPTVCVRSGGFSVDELRDAGAATVVDDLPAVQRHWAAELQGRRS